MALDYSRFAQERTRLADAVDAAVLAVGSQPAMSDAAAFAAVNAWISAQMRSDPYVLDSVVQDGSSITAKAHTDVSTSLARVRPRSWRRRRSRFCSRKLIIRRCGT